MPVTDADRLDPDIRTFITRMTKSFARYPSLDLLGFPEARRVAEEVRAPWRQGGPAMVTSTEMQVPVRGGNVRVRIHDPLDAGSVKGALVYLHGGGWSLFSIDTHDRVMREYAARAGVIVVGVDYALSPENKFPVALWQIVDVVRWLEAHGPALGIDPARLAIGGDSAGGNLSMATALALRDAGEPHRLKAMILNYGAFSTRLSISAERDFGGEGYMLGGEEMRVFWRNYFRTPDDANDPLACPMKAQLENLPPVFLTVPECDVLTEQSFEMAEKLTAAGVPVRLEHYVGASHSFLEAVSISSLADRAFADGAQWLRETLG